MQAVKLCTNEILQFLTGGASYRIGRKMVVVVVVVGLFFSRVFPL